MNDKKSAEELEEILKKILKDNNAEIIVTHTDTWKKICEFKQTEVGCLNLYNNIRVLLDTSLLINEFIIVNKK